MGANGKGKARAKDGPSIGKAKPKGKAKSQGKAKPKGKAQPQEPVSSSDGALGPKGGKGWATVQPGQPMGQLGAQAVKDHLKALVAADPKKNNHLSEHYEELRKYSDQLHFALQLKLDMSGSFMTASETHASAFVDKSGFEDGWIEGSMAANRLGLLMWSTDQTHKERDPQGEVG